MQVIFADISGFPCPYCGKEYKEKRVMKVHVRDIHEETQTYVCNFCEKIFKNRNTLANHKSTFHR